MEGQVLFYEGKYYMFSNFSAFAVYSDSELYPTVEHTYQAQKYAVSRIRRAIREAHSPVEAKFIAQSYSHSMRREWCDALKLNVMETLLRTKTLMHFSVLDALHTTGQAEIVENSPTDSFWGWGPDRQGQNHLGKIWMKIRAELRAQK